MNTLNIKTTAKALGRLGLLALALLLGAMNAGAIPGINDLAGNALATFPYTNGQSYIYAPNNAPTDISLSASSVNQSAGVNATIGALTTTDADIADGHTYTLVSGAGAADNGSFNILTTSLRANDASALAAGGYFVRIQTDDGQGGTFQKAFVITIADDIAPVITSAGSANATNGIAFSYVITASGGATMFNASGLPAGLNVDTNSGAISGTPSLAGVFNAKIMAADVAGNTVTNSLSLNVAKANATVSFGNLSQPYDGSARTVTVSSTPSNLTVNVTYNGNAAPPTNSGSYVVVGTIADANYAGAGTNTLVIGKAVLSVKADDATRTYGQTNPIFTGSITGVLPGDNLSASFASSATPTSMSGTYSIVPAINDPNGKIGNYQVGITNGTLTVTALPLVLSIESIPAAVQPQDSEAGILFDHARVWAAGEAGRSYDILVSTNFVQWSVLTNIVGDTNGTVEFMDWQMPGRNLRFFRAQIQ